MEFKGIITKVVERKGTSERTGNEWKTVGFIFEFKEHDTDPWNDRVYLETFDENYISQIKEGALVKVGFRHATREWNGRIYNDLRMNSFEVLRKKEDKPQPIKFVEQTEAIQPTPEGDDLPF
jgi:hypothetical protein